MSHRTLRQLIKKKMSDYGMDVPIDSYFIDYLPLDEIATLNCYMMTNRPSATIPQYDFTSDLIADSDLPRSIQASGNLHFEFVGTFGSGSYDGYMMYAGKRGALGAWSGFTIGAITGTTGKIDVSSGSVTITRLTGTDGSDTWTPAAAVGDDIAILLHFNNHAARCDIYEASYGEAFALVGQIDLTGLLPITYSANTPLTINSVASSDTYGVAMIQARVKQVANPPVKNSSEIISELTTIKDNWIDGIRGFGTLFTS